MRPHGADVDDEVGGTHHVLVVFDDDHRVAGIAQLLQAADQAPVVALVQADRGLVEDIKHVDQLRADLRGEADTLALAARERTRRTRQRQVAQPHVHQEAQALADLLDDLLCDLPLLVVHIILDVRHPFRKFGDRHGRHVGDALAADAELERLLLEARTAADRTFAVDEELLAPFLAAFGVLVFGTAYIFGDALPRDEVVAARRTELRKVDGQRLGIAVQHRIQPRLGQRPDGVVEREIVTPPQHFENGEKHVVAVFAQRFDGALAQRKPHVGNDLPDVEDGFLAQPVAMRAGALGRVERKGMRRGVFERDARRGAHQVAGVEALLFGTVVVDGHRTLALAQRLPERGHHPVAGLLADDQAVDHQVDGVYLVPVEAHAGRNLADLAVDTGIDIPLFGQRLEQFAVMPLAPFDDGSHQGDLAPREARHDEPGDLLVGIMHHLLARDG